MKLANAGIFMMGAILAACLMAGFGLPDWARGAASTTQDFDSSMQVILSDTPIISQVILNDGDPIILIPGATTTIPITFTLADGAGCGDVFTSGTVDVVLSRSSLGASCQQSDKNCYTTSTLVHSCTPGSTSTTANATATVPVYFFADATDSSSTYDSDDWRAFISASDEDARTGEASSTAVELNTLLAIELNTYSIDYGQVSKGADTGAANQSTTIANAGNAKLNIKVAGTAMTSGGSSFATSSQHYASSSFTYGGPEQSLSDIAQIISGVTMKVYGAIADSMGGLVSGWELDRALPTTLINHSATSYQNTIFVTGGYTSAGTSTILYSKPNLVDGTLSTWTNASSMPYTAYYHSAIVDGDFLYIVGGLANGGTATRTVIYAPITSSSVGTWTNATPLPAANSAAGVATQNGYLYVIGGNNSGATSGVVYASINATGSIGSWISTESIPFINYDHYAIGANGYIYSIGGLGSGQTSTVLYSQVNATGSLGAWQYANPVPFSTSYLSAVVKDDFLYVIGGKIAGINNASSVVYAKLNATGSLGTWQFASSMPFTNYQHSAAVVDKYLYVLGGSASNTATSSVIYSEFNPPPLGSNTSTIYWGTAVPGNADSGSYSSTITYTAVWAP